MELFGLLGFIFGIVSFVRVQQLTRALKAQGVLELGHANNSHDDS